MCIKGQTPAPISKELDEHLKHEWESEKNAVATIVYVIIPSFYPLCKSFLEIGPIFVDGKIRGKLLEATANGFVQCTSGEDKCLFNIEGQHHERLVVEIKCPMVNEELQLGPYYKIPSYYVAQVLAEMATHNVNNCLYVCYTSEGTTVVKVHFDKNLWERIFNPAERLFDPEKVNIPTKLDPGTNRLREDVKVFADTHSYFLCEVPSLIGNEQDIVEEEIISSPHFSNPEKQLSEASRVHIEEVCNVISLDTEQFLKEASNLSHIACDSSLFSC